MHMNPICHWAGGLPLFTWAPGDDKEVDTMSKNLTTLLEPIMLIVMGVAIGFVVASVLGPIYSLVNAF